MTRIVAITERQPANVAAKPTCVPEMGRHGGDANAEVVG